MRRRQGWQGPGQVSRGAASEDDLIKLPGIGAVRAKAIIKHRPYRAKDELVERKVITAAVYEKIKERVIARQAK